MPDIATTNPTKDFQKIQAAAKAGDKDAILFLAKMADLAAAIDTAALPGADQGRAEALKRFGSKATA